jgi:peptidoglycan/LPS O-acetylase OafA/YrhL
VFGLDLARALAITMVLQVHFGFAALWVYGRQGVPAAMALLGGLGVELFFVLSGFLIGGLLLDVSERSPTRRAWLLFLTRRWMRTIPLYALWIVIMVSFSALAGRHLDHALAYLTFTQNLAWPMPPNSWFGVSWSLSVEEWFYLLFSAVFLALAAIWPRRALPVSCAMFVLVPILLRFTIADAANSDEGLRKVVIYRLDAIVYGVMVVWCYRQFPHLVLRLRWVLLGAGLALVLSPSFVAGIGAALAFTLYPIAMALCLPALVGLPSPRPAVVAVIHWLSTRSYGLYIIHLTLVIAALKLRHPSPAVWLVAAFGGSLWLADVLYRYFERPILRLRPPQFPQRQAEETLPSAAPAPVSQQAQAL